MILIQQKYTSSSSARQAELDRTVASNAAAGLFRQISQVDGSTRRLTYTDLFEHAHRHFPGEICVVANSDISFDDTLNRVVPHVMANVMIALSRWESDTAPIMGGHVDDEDGGKLFSQSQDVWIFRGGALPTFDTNFQLGILACETRMAYEAAKAGVLILNPALSIRTRHHHESNVRTYTIEDVYEGPRYLPRMTTIEAPVAEGYVVDTSRRPKRRIVRLTGSATSFAEQTTSNPEPLSKRRLGFRSPIYFRRRSA